MWDAQFAFPVQIQVHSRLSPTNEMQTQNLQLSVKNCWYHCNHVSQENPRAPDFCTNLEARHPDWLWWWKPTSGGCQWMQVSFQWRLWCMMMYGRHIYSSEIYTVSDIPRQVFPLVEPLGATKCGVGQAGKKVVDSNPPSIQPQAWDTKFIQKHKSCE